MTTTDWEICWEKVTADTYDFGSWESLIKFSEQANGGIRKGSDEQDISNLKMVYDRFLAQFPLCFGYWKKYADWQLTLYDTEHAEQTYERGIVAISNSIDLWLAYINFKIKYNAHEDSIRQLFERAAISVGYDFYGHPFWDLYIHFEEQKARQDLVLNILERVIYIPMYQYARYFEKYTQVAMGRDPSELLDPEEIAKIDQEIRKETSRFDEETRETVPKTEQDYTNELAQRIHTLKTEIYLQTQEAVNARWPFEAEIKRPFFHIRPLDPQQLDNWRKYLDFEEKEGDFTRTYILYERCLIPCALYPEFWSRYAHFLNYHGHKDNVRYIFQKAIAAFIPVSKPQMRFQYAEFEEVEGMIDDARKVYDDLIQLLPGHFEALQKRVLFEKRQNGYKSAVELLEKYQSTLENKTTTASLVAVHCKMLELESSVKKQQVRQVITKGMNKYGLSDLLALEWMNYEIKNQDSKELLNAWDTIVNDEKVSVKAKTTVSKAYSNYLLISGDLKQNETVQTFIDLKHFPFSNKDQVNGKRKRDENE